MQDCVLVQDGHIRFFDKYLKGIPSTILDDNQEVAYPEVTYERKFVMIDQEDVKSNGGPNGQQSGIYQN